MSQHTLTCIVIHRNPEISQALEDILRKANFNVTVHLVKNWQAFEKHLIACPALVFSAGDLPVEQENRVLEALQQRSPDTVLVKASARHWEPLSTRLLGVEICTVVAAERSRLRQQVDFLLHYSSLKTHFRQCKHLFSIAELRCQWLVDYSREPVAFVVGGRHLHANVAYLSLFGCQSEAEILSVPLLQLVKRDEQRIFKTLSSSAELSAKPSNKLLLTLNRVDKRPFRAEIRFIPSVFRGQRCVQLHVHPVATVATQPRPVRPNPWEKPEVAAGIVDGKQVVQPQSRMQAHFQEALNMRASSRPRLLVAEPFLNHESGRRVGFREVVADADKSGKRQRLDWWNIRQSVLQVRQQPKHPMGQSILIAVGPWLFTQLAQTRALINLLGKNRQIASRLVFAFRLSDYSSNNKTAPKVLHGLRATGAQLAVDNVLNADLRIIQLARALGADMVRLHPGYLKDMASKGAVPIPLQEVIQNFDGAGITVVVDGVQDITSLNLLCVTPTTYLQGEILNKFSR